MNIFVFGSLVIAVDDWCRIIEIGSVGSIGRNDIMLPGPRRKRAQS